MKLLFGVMIGLTLPLLLNAISTTEIGQTMNQPMKSSATCTQKS